MIGGVQSREATRRPSERRRRDYPIAFSLAKIITGLAIPGGERYDSAPNQLRESKVRPWGP